MYTLHQLRKRSIAKDYILIVGSIVLTLIILSIGYTVHIYQSKDKALRQEILTASKQISHEMEDSLDYIKYVASYLGNEIIKKDNDIQSIAKILRSKLVTESEAQKKFSWTIFDWITPEKKMVASTMEGVFKTPRDISNRYYTQVADTIPWVLHFDKANIGIPSGEWIIPVGMGITDHNNKFIGIISSGIRIPKVTRNLEEAIDNKQLSFIILDKDLNITIHSSDIAASTINPTFFSENKELLSNKESTFLSQKIEFNNNIYTHQSALKKYPYTILVGYNQTLANYAFNETIIPILITMLTLGSICIILLIFLRHLLVDPIIELSHAVDRLTQGKTIGKFKKCKTYETLNLAAQIIKLKRLLAYEKSSRITLKNTLEIAHKSDLEKAKFLEHIHEEVHKPIKSIIKDTSTLREVLENQKKPLTRDKQLELLERVEQTANSIQSFSNNILDITPIRIRKVIENSITIIAKNAHNKNSRLSLFIPTELPLYYGDEIKLQQIIIGLLSRSLEQTSENGEIHITAQIKEEENNSYLEIIITDNGFGLDETDIKRIKSKVDDKTKTTYGIEGMSLELPIIQKLIELHKGKLSIRNNINKGTKTTITLPFLNRNELQSTYIASIKEKEKKTNKSEIISFPKKKK